MTGGTDLASRYPRPGFPGVAWLREHPPLTGLRIVLGWAAGLAVLEILAAVLAPLAFAFALVDLVLVPAGLLAGCWGLLVRYRRRSEAMVRAHGQAGGEATAAARLRGSAQQWDVLVHGVLLANLLVFGVLLLAAQADGDGLGVGAFGPILIASALIPASVIATWSTSRPATVDGEAVALVHGLGRPTVIRRTRWLVRIALAPHIVLGVATVIAFGEALT